MGVDYQILTIISKVKLLQIATWIRYGLFKYRSVLKLREYNSAMTQVML